MSNDGDTGPAIYVDESIHTSLGFIVSAMIFSGTGLSDSVEKALTQQGLRPNVDEFKSGTHMGRNPSMAALRDELLGVASHQCKIGLAFSPSDNRADLGAYCLDALEVLLRRNAISPDKLSIHFDEGVFSSPKSVKDMSGALELISRARIFPSQKSHTCLGIQVADAVAHTASQIVREQLTGKEKMVNIGGEGTGYHPDEEAPLGWALRTQLRYAFFRRPVVEEGHGFDPKTEPKVVPIDEDLVDVAIQPEVVGWGVHLADGLPADVQDAIRESLGTIWLGCIH